MLMAFLHPKKVHFIYLLLKYLFIWRCQVLVVAHEIIFHLDMQELVP